ncbi:MAG TPA: carbohydrate-binding protein, partial [Bacteroidales bacterium]|nr:carbohydrate-binding protein [Bacteroidales bacterium]
AENSKILEFTTVSEFTYFDELLLSYDGGSVMSGTQMLGDFSNLSVTNNLPLRHAVPGKIEAEDFHFNNGFTFENTSDTGGGKNSSYARAGYYLDYLISVQNTAYYDLTMRVASEHGAPKLSMWLSEDNGETFEQVAIISLNGTGGWGTWQTQSGTTVLLNKGEYQLRFKVEQQEHNLNWFEFKQNGEVISDDPDEIFSATNFQISYVSPSCYQLDDGSITILSKVAAVNVTLDNGSSHPISQNIEYTITDLSAGEYNLIATSVNNYDSHHKVILNQAQPLYSNAVVEGNNVSFRIEGGEAPYIIELNGQNHVSQSSVFTLKNLSSGNYTATVMDNNQCSENANLSFSINSLQVYPNPVSNGFLYVICPAGTEVQNFSLKVFSSNGQQLISQQKRTQNNRISLDVSQLVSGLYLLKVANDSFSDTIHFMVP